MNRKASAPKATFVSQFQTHSLAHTLLFLHRLPCFLSVIAITIPHAPTITSVSDISNECCMRHVVPHI